MQRVARGVGSPVVIGGVDLFAGTGGEVVLEGDGGAIEGAVAGFLFDQPASGVLMESAPVASLSSRKAVRSLIWATGAKTPQFQTVAVMRLSPGLSRGARSKRS